MFEQITRSDPFIKVRDFVRSEVWVLGIMGVASGLLLGFLSLADEVTEGETMAFDTAVLMLFRDPSNIDEIVGAAWVKEMFRDITALGSFTALGLLTAAVVVTLFMVHKRSAALLVLVSVVTGSVLSTLLKLGYDRPRPDLVTMTEQFTSSFPSGHAMLSAVTFLTIGALLARLAPSARLRVFAIALAVFLTLLVGVSRVYLGVHYPSDVLAGWTLGAAWALFCSGIELYLQNRGSVEEPHETTETKNLNTAPRR